MGWQDKLNTLRRNVAVNAHQAYRGAQVGARQAYEGAKVAHAKYNAYQEQQYRAKLEAVRKQKALVKEEAAVNKYQYQKKEYKAKTYGTSSRMEQHSLSNSGYRATGQAGLNGVKEGRVSNNMDRQGGYQGGYKQYGGEAPLFHRPKYEKNWWE